MSVPSPATLDRMREHLDEEARSGHGAAELVAPELAAVRDRAAAAVGADPAEVALVTSATEATQLALAAIPWQPGDRVVADREEYFAQALTYRLLKERRGVELVVVDHDEDGLLDLDALDAALDGGARLVSLPHVPMWNGVVQPVAEVAGRAHAAGAMVLLDAAQSLGHVPVDAHGTGADIVVATGRKWVRGPRGTGLLVLRGAAADLAPAWPSFEGVTDPGPDAPLVLARGARAFERYEAGVAALLGLGVALGELLSAGVADTAARIAERGTALRARLARIHGVRPADPPAVTGAIVALTVDGVAADQVVAGLRDRGVRGRVVHGDLVPWSAHLPVVRLSPHVYTTDAELDAAAGALAAVAA